MNMKPADPIIRFVMIAAALPLVSLPFVFAFFEGTPHLTWLQVLSATLLGVAALLAILEHLNSSVSKMCQKPLPPTVKYVTFLALALVLMWSVLKTD
jgi:hypothetical protein